VLLGLNEDNKDADGAKCENYTDTATQLNLTISGLTHTTNYACYYACYNSYPTWPTPNETAITSVITTQTA